MNGHTTATDWYPMLLTRAWPFRDHLPEFDDYQRDIHFPDLLRAPGAHAAAAYANITEDLPQAFLGSGNRLANYTSISLDALFTWLRSTELAEAVDDGGTRWFSRLNELDGALYTGNVYEVAHVSAVADREASAPMLVERFEVPADDQPAFDKWLKETHLPSIARVPGVARVRCCEAVRQGIPVPYYLSPGNRMLVVDFESDSRLLTTLLADTMIAAISDSQRWDRRLRYVRRDVYRFLFAGGV